ncbi:phosphate acyltransferase [Mesorhizobium sp. M0220]|uniref:phosphate acyltransferase n=1 Tax=Mesorhizobium sp. M0220 TaxID=2956920 RepID=UPI0033378C94
MQAIKAAEKPRVGGSTVIGPPLVGLNKPVQIVSLNAKGSDIVNMAAIAAYGAGLEERTAAAPLPSPLVGEGKAAAAPTTTPPARPLGADSAVALGRSAG